jgi:hypothetical protein
MVRPLLWSDRSGYTELVTGEVEMLPSTTYLPSRGHFASRSSVVSDPGTGSPGAGDEMKERLCRSFVVPGQRRREEAGPRCASTRPAGGTPLAAPVKTCRACGLKSSC